MICLHANGQQTIRTPYGPATIPGNNTYRHPDFYYGNSKPVNARYPFNIILKNDSAFTVVTKIDMEENPNRLSVKVGKEKKIFYPTDTKRIFRVTSYGERIEGIPTDSCWLFKTSVGRINTYSRYSEPGMDFIILIQKGDDAPIVELNETNLAEMVADDEKATAYIKKRKLIKSIQTYNK